MITELIHFIRKDHIPDHKVSLNKFKKIEIVVLEQLDILMPKEMNLDTSYTFHKH